METTYDNLTTQPFSAESLQKALDELRAAKDDMGKPIEMKVDGKWIRPLWISHGDFHNLINTAKGL